jgi:hypothetical protein
MISEVMEGTSFDLYPFFFRFLSSNSTIVEKKMIPHIQGTRIKVPSYLLTLKEAHQLKI